MFKRIPFYWHSFWIIYCSCFILKYSTGGADAHLWEATSNHCAISAISDELGLVCKDYQRVEEDFGEETVRKTASK